jgi:hypothetical protein
VLLVWVWVDQEGLEVGVGGERRGWGGGVSLV